MPSKRSKRERPTAPGWTCDCADGEVAWQFNARGYGVWWCRSCGAQWERGADGKWRKVQA